MSSVLIIGRHNDPHTKAVAQELEGLGRQVQCLDSFRGDPVHIHILSRSDSLSDWQSLGELESLEADVDAVWLRQKPVIPEPWWSPLQHDAARFSQEEWRCVIQSSEDFLPQAYWINSPEAQRRINYKPRQLGLAAKLGLNVPDTAITNDPKVVSDLRERHERIIYKSLGAYVFTDQTGILTTLVTRERLEQNGEESIRRAPGIYQQFIPKAFEARITVVGSRLFVAHIRTPKTGPGSVDWRHAQFEDIFEEGDISNEIATGIARFQEAAVLRYGAYDFLISPEGKWYFLECNPVGQYLWLEHALGHRISRAIAEELCLGGSSGRQPCGDHAQSDINSPFGQLGTVMLAPRTKSVLASR